MKVKARLVVRDGRTTLLLTDSRRGKDRAGCPKTFVIHPDKPFRQRIEKTDAPVTVMLMVREGARVLH